MNAAVLDHLLPVGIDVRHAGVETAARHLPFMHFRSRSYSLQRTRGAVEDGGDKMAVAIFSRVQR